MKYLFFAFFILLSFSSGAQEKTNFTRQDYSKFITPTAVPVDLKKNDHILQVMSPFTEKQSGENAKLQALFDKYYNGKILLVPNGSKFGSEKSYQDTSVYKYMLMIRPASDFANRPMYALTMVDKTFIQMSGGKRVTDPKAFIKTGLEDYPGKLDNMLIYYAGRLSAAEE